LILDRDRRLRRHVVWEVIGAFLDVGIVRFLLETGFPLFVFGQRLGVAGSVPKMLRCGFVEGSTISVGRFAGGEGGSWDIDSFVLTNKTRRSIVLLVKQVRGLADLVPL